MTLEKRKYPSKKITYYKIHKKRRYVNLYQIFGHLASIACSMTVGSALSTHFVLMSYVHTLLQTFGLRRACNVGHDSVVLRAFAYRTKKGAPETELQCPAAQSAKFSTDCFFDINIKLIAFLTINLYKIRE